MTPLHRLTLTHRDDVLEVGVSGEIDMSNAAELESAVLAAVTATSAAMLVDLTGLHFLDSAGVRFLDHVAAAQQPQRPLLVVAVPTGRVRATLRLCGFPDELLRADVDVARAELAGSADR